MTICVYTVSTTGLFNPERDVSHPSQPRMIGMAAVLLSPKWQERGAFHCLVQSEGTVTSAGAKAAHGISDRERDVYGVRRKTALLMLMDLSRVASELCGWALDFNQNIIDIELDRLQANVADWKRGGLKRTSIMQEASARWNGGRPMKLADAHGLATGIAYESPERDKHLYDVRAAVRVLMELRRPK